VSKFLWPFRQGRGRTKSGIHSTADNLGCCARHPVACALADGILCYPRSQAKKGFFSCRLAGQSDHRLAHPAQTRKVDRVSLPDGPFPRLLLAAEERGGRLAQGDYFGDEVPKLSYSTDI
jgi:hypothetical protein